MKRKLSVKQVIFLLFALSCLKPVLALDRTSILNGKVEESAGEEANNSQLSIEKGQKDNQDGIKMPVLQGSAQLRVGNLGEGEDPDADDKELMIAWDRWRNRFLQAVIASTTEMLNSDQSKSFQFNPTSHTIESKFPLGTTAWFACEVTKDRQIRNLRILQSSGFAAYDQAVLDAVQALQGSNLLKFPMGSRRIVVLQGGGIERSAQPDQQYFHFGDVERYRVPAY